MKKALSILLVTVLTLPGCAISRGSQRRTSTAPAPNGAGSTVMADYIRQLPVGARVRLSRADGDQIRGTLIKNDGDPVIVQRRARIPEAPIEVPLREVVAVELDAPASGVGRAIAIGAGAAVAATLGVFLVMAALLSD